MFSPSIVGLANALSAGWANLGSASAQFLLPLIFSFFNTRLGLPQFSAWRAAFFVPSALQVISVLAVLAFGYDLPDAKICRRNETTQGNKASSNFLKILKDELGNYRGWILGLTYGFSYGVELTMENILAEYY